MKNKCYNNGMKLGKQLPNIVWFIEREPNRRTIKKSSTTELRSWQESGTQRYNKYRNESEADGAKKDIQKWINTLHLRCWDCPSFPAFNETMSASSFIILLNFNFKSVGHWCSRWCRPPSRREFWQFPFERGDLWIGGNGDSRGLGTVGDRRQADQQCLALWNFHWSKHQHNYCKVNSILDSSLVILALHSTLSFLKSEITNWTDYVVVELWFL